MKKILLTCAAIAMTLSAPAQLFSPESLNGAFLGSFIGGIAGGDCHHGFSGEGAAIGAGVGLLAGAIAGEVRRRDYESSQPYAYSPAPSVSVGYGSYGSSAYVYYSPNSYTAPGYYYRPTRPNYAVGGTLLGAASGALIGSASHDAGAGAAIGAAAGLVLGSVAEVTARHREKKTAETAQPPTQPAPESQVANGPPPAQVTSTPGPTSTYHWTPRPQIPDAPGVPDAPTF